MKRRVILCVALVLFLLLLLAPGWLRLSTGRQFERRAGRTFDLTPVRTGAAVRSNAAAVIRNPRKLDTSIGGRDGGCPSGFVTISNGGRLGNKMCQYASLWALQRDDARARPAWLLPEMKHALGSLFPNLALPTLSDSCVRQERRFRWMHYLPYLKFDRMVFRPPRRPLLLSEYPCDLNRFHKYRDELQRQLTFRAAIRRESQQRLRQYTSPLCRGPPACTYIGVHVRRTDYRAAVRHMFNGTLAGETYLRRALALCRRRYRLPVFLVSSDDLTWVRRRLSGPDIVIAGSSGPRSAGRDLALLSQCNHTVMTHGTYGFWAAFLARGDVIAPTGFGERDDYLSEKMKQRGFNLTYVPAF